MKIFTIICARLGIFVFGALAFANPAQAILSQKLNVNSLSSARFARAKEFVNTQVRADVMQNLDARIAQVTEKAAVEKEPAMSKETQAILLKGAFLSLQSAAPFPVSEADFNRGMARILDFLAEHKAFPQAITIGLLQRVTMGEGVVAGGSVGIEGNFYLKKGKLMMTNYSLVGAQVGVGVPTAMSEYYAALCFGMCYGGDPNGWYLGFDGNIAAGLGVGFFLEVGVDVSDYFDSFVSDRPFTLRDMYEAAAVYVGFGFEIGVGGGVAGNLFHYSQIGTDTVLADLTLNSSKKLNPRMILSNSSFLKH